MYLQQFFLLAISDNNAILTETKRKRDFFMPSAVINASPVGPFARKVLAKVVIKYFSSQYHFLLGVEIAVLGHIMAIYLLLKPKTLTTCILLFMKNLSRD